MLVIFSVYGDNEGFHKSEIPKLVINGSKLSDSDEYFFGMLSSKTR